MKNLLFFVIASVFLWVGCNGRSFVGFPCVDDSDCGSGFCLRELNDGAQKDPKTIEFVNGMCTEDCEEIGGFEGSKVCLQYSPTNQMFLFDLCRNDNDCRVDDSYYCVWVGSTSNSVDAQLGINACLPEDAIH